MFDWFSLPLATFVGGGALWLVQRAGTRMDKRLDAFVSKPVCDARMEAGDERMVSIDKRLDRVDNRLEGIQRLQAQTLLEIRRNGKRGASP